ncbi:uncharacterized protein LOC110845946 [Folsomia candida]|uniref:uncharacterized protein LOC110845946 n=1 Tax=Folsomia candida TaxID=158441 RepID=UPI001604CBAF|nr:uncharacterized protein LOC110845946 [Folsomia candida]
MTDVRDGNAIVPNKTRVIIIYPTVSPEVVIVPIVSSILVFPIVAFIIICCLRRRAARARQKARMAKREDPYLSERSCASVVRNSPPISWANTHGRNHRQNHNNPMIQIESEITTTVEIVITPDVDLEDS